MGPYLIPDSGSDIHICCALEAKQICLPHTCVERPHDIALIGNYEPASCMIFLMALPI